MSVLWLAASLGLVAALTLATLATVRGHPARRIVALQAANAVLASLVVAVAAGQGERAYLDVALALVLAGLVGTLLLARFLERWL